MVCMLKRRTSLVIYINRMKIGPPYSAHLYDDMLSLIIHFEVICNIKIVSDTLIIDSPFAELHIRMAKCKTEISVPGVESWFKKSFVDCSC